MQNKKETKTKLQIIFSALLLSVIFIAEFYAIVNYPKQYIFIAGFAVLFLVILYVLINGLFSMRIIKNERREEQYENIFKSEKASYLMLKKYFEEIEDKVDILMSTAKVPTDEIINAQKGVAKVIINRSRENAEALMNSNDIVMDKLDSFEQSLNNNNNGLLEGQKNIVTDNFNQIVIKQQELAAAIKDMELRINQAIMQTQQMISTQPVQLTAKVDIPQQPVTVQMPAMQMAAPVMPPQMYAQQPAAQPTQVVNEEPVINEEHVVMETSQVAEEEIMPEIIPEPEVAEAEIVSEPEAMPELEAVEEITEVEAVPEPIEEAEPEPVPEPEAEPVEEAEPEPVPEPEAEPVAEEPEAEPVEEPAPAAPEIDMSDPNKKMSPDDIAALFASMGGGDDAPAEPEAEPVEEPAPVAPEPVAEESAPEPAPVEEAAPEPAPAAPEIDMSDPNKKMSPDDIAALFASMGGGDDAPTEAEPVAEEPAPEPAPAAPEIDMSDPNKKMDPDEIAALIASMGGGGDAPAEPEPVPEPEPEKPPMPDLSDPNKKMSPDEIAALIANM